MSSKTGTLREFGKFRLDAEKRVLWCENKPVNLPLKEIEMLCALTEKSGEVITKDELMSQVWKDSFVEESNLSRNIYGLRKMFRDFGAEDDLIETVPRRGYRFAAEVREIPHGELVIEKHTLTRTTIEILDGADETATKTETSKNLVSEKVSPKNKRIFAAAALILLSLFAAGFAYWRYDAENVPPTEIRSIAVLPLKSFSAGTGDESLRMRITDALITRLGSFDKISVRPTNAVLPFAGAEQNALEIGVKLRADAILDGRIQQENERIRVTLQLIRVADGKQIWAEQFDGQADEILNLQDLIAAKLLQALNPNSSKSSELAARPTENAEAYEAYLRGRFHWNKRSAEGFEQAVIHFEKAITLDAKFAEAYSGLSDVYLGFYDYGIKPADECIPQAKSAINQALQLKPNSAEAYSTLSAIQFLYDRNWSEAEKSIVKSIELNPQYSTAHLRYGWYLTMTGRFDEARRELETALEQDPTSAIVQTNIGYLLTCTGNNDDAERRFAQIIEAHPQFSLPYWYRGSIYFQQNNRTAMFENYLKAFELDNGKEASTKIRESWQNKGEAAALTVWRETLENDARKSHLPPSNIALIAAIQQDKEAALNWLTKAETQKDPWLLQIKYDHEYDFLRSEPRFQEILRKMNL